MTDEVPTCGRCGKQHTTYRDRPSCTSHRSRNHPTDPGGPCGRDPMRGQTVCQKHGGAAPQSRAAGERRDNERRTNEQARKLIPDVADRTRITNPLETLLELASEANAFRESLRVMANELDGKIRYAAAGGTGEQLRAEVATYRQALKDTTDLLVAIARLDIEKMLARVTVRQAEQTLESLAAGCDDAGLDDDTKRKVIAGVGRHLRLVRRPAA